MLFGGPLSTTAPPSWPRPHSQSLAATPGGSPPPTTDASCAGPNGARSAAALRPAASRAAATEPPMPDNGRGCAMAYVPAKGSGGACVHGAWGSVKGCGGWQAPRIAASARAWHTNTLLQSTHRPRRKHAPARRRTHPAGGALASHAAGAVLPRRCRRSAGRQAWRRGWPVYTGAAKGVCLCMPVQAREGQPPCRDPAAHSTHVVASTLLLCQPAAARLPPHLAPHTPSLPAHAHPPCRPARPPAWPEACWGRRPRSAQCPALPCQRPVPPCRDVRPRTGPRTRPPPPSRRRAPAGPRRYLGAEGTRQRRGRRQRVTGAYAHACAGVGGALACNKRLRAVQRTRQRTSTWPSACCCDVMQGFPPRPAARTPGGGWHSTKASSMDAFSTTAGWVRINGAKTGHRS